MVSGEGDGSQTLCPHSGTRKLGFSSCSPPSKGGCNGPSLLWAEDPGTSTCTGGAMRVRVGRYGGGSSWSNRSAVEGSWGIDFSDPDPSSCASFFLMDKTCEVGLGERKTFIHGCGLVFHYSFR